MPDKRQPRTRPFPSTTNRNRKRIASALGAMLLLVGAVWWYRGHGIGDAAGDIGFYTPPAEAGRMENPPAGRVRNVILLIGDGMGPAPLAYASLRATGPDGRLHIERMPCLGSMRTFPVGSWVTDSAAAATAMATGHKTMVGLVGVAPDGRTLPTVLEQAQREGFAVGLVSTHEIVDATPAAFVAHVDSRGQREEIARQMTALRPDVVLGGGRKYFLPDDRKGRRKDGRDLVAEWVAQGYPYAEDAKQLADIPVNGDGRLLGLFSRGHMETARPEPTLLEMTCAALAHLDGKRDAAGLFLMVEGAKIDRMGHENRAGRMVEEILHFDLAVGEALRFARERGDTLVVVTADHDTGGLGVVAGPDKARIGWGSKGHTAVPVPVFAYGPGAERFAGLIDNTDIHDFIADALALPESRP